MRKFQMVQTFRKLEAIESALSDDTDLGKAEEAVYALRAHLEEVREGWWHDSTAVFRSLCKHLDAYYRESWNPHFVATDKQRKARNRYANIILDQIRQSYR